MGTSPLHLLEHFEHVHLRQFVHLAHLRELLVCVPEKQRTLHH